MSLAPTLQTPAEAGKKLASMVAGTDRDGLVVVGVAGDGVLVAAEVARLLEVPLDIVAIGRDREPAERLPDLNGAGVVLVDDEVVSGSTMRAAIRTARLCGAARIVVAVPLATVDGLTRVLGDVTETACLHVVRDIAAVTADQ